MRQQIQAILHKPEEGQFGDCMRTSYAMLLNLDLHEIPNFGDPASHVGRTWRQARDEWLGQRGLGVIEIPFDCPITSLVDQLIISCSPGVGAFVSGMSPRGTPHETVFWDGVIIDPHPEGGGLVGPHEDGYFWVSILTPLSA